MTTKSKSRRRSKTVRRVKDENSFSSILRKIRKAPPNQIISIPIKYYTQKVELRGEVNRLVFKNFIKGAEMMTPRIDEAAVENLFGSGPDNINVGETFTLFHDNQNTGFQLQLHRKPSLEELVSDNYEEDEYGVDIYKESGKPMNIVYIFTKV